MGTQNRSRGARRYTVEPDTDFLVRRAGVEDALQIADVHVAAWRETYGPLLPAGALDSLDAGERAQKWAGVIAGGYRGAGGGGRRGVSSPGLRAGRDVTTTHRWTANSRASTPLPASMAPVSDSCCWTR